MVCLSLRRRIRGCDASIALQQANKHPLSAPSFMDMTEFKLATNIKIAMLFLEDDDAVAAETYIKKASSLLSSCKVRVVVGVQVGVLPGQPWKLEHCDSSRSAFSLSH